jgi:hypothetical protein
MSMGDIHSLLESVPLPGERFQEIKRMVMKHSTHGLFLTSTQNLICIYITHNQSSIKNSLVKRQKGKKAPTYMEVWCFAHGGESPSILVPCNGSSP